MRLCALPVLLLAVTASALHAQQGATTPDTATPDTSTQPIKTPFVLHVYANLVQVPTLVLSTSQDFLPPQPREKFEITIDAGRRFHPTQMHIEGNEPISLAILLDASSGQNDLLKPLPELLAALAPGSLHPVDRVSVYAYDCRLMRSALNLPADATTLGPAVVRALAAPNLHGTTPRRSCKEITLWDAAASTLQSIANLPGRRVLLILSDGHSNPGNVAFDKLTDMASTYGIAIFGIREAEAFAVGSSTFSAGGRRGAIAAPSPVSYTENEDLFDLLCQLNGGLVLSSTSRELAKTLQRFVTMVRGRYILEFPRPDQNLPGKHQIDVTLTDRAAFIRPAGVTVPGAIAPDADTVPSQASPANYGKRHPIN